MNESKSFTRLRSLALPLGRAERIELLRREITLLEIGERFRLLHELGIYHGTESLSGDGSSLAETAALRDALPRIFRERGIRSLLDAPCGDHFWMSRVDLSGMDYTGVDVVPELVRHDTERYSSVSRRFVVLDLTRDPLPAADLILCRDLLIHLSLADAMRLLVNLKTSGARWFLGTHYWGARENLEIISGDFRPVNLCRPPFSFPEPEEVIPEESAQAGGLFPDRAMALWPAAALPTG